MQRTVPSTQDSPTRGSRRHDSMTWNGVGAIGSLPHAGPGR